MLKITRPFINTKFFLQPETCKTTDKSNYSIHFGSNIEIMKNIVYENMMKSINIELACNTGRVI